MTLKEEILEIIKEYEDIPMCEAGNSLKDDLRQLLKNTETQESQS